MTENEILERMYPEAYYKPEYVICAAIYWKDGIVHPHQPKNIESGFVICGRRHHNCFIAKIMSEFSEADGKSVQGFLTSKDRFIDRKEAGQLAFEAKQISEPNDCLFSEDLY